jgi:hypothetical protein
LFAVRLAVEYQTLGAKIVCVDIDKESQLSNEHEISSVLTLTMFYKEGSKVFEQAGALSEDRLKEIFNNALT